MLLTDKKSHLISGCQKQSTGEMETLKPGYKRQRPWQQWCRGKKFEGVAGEESAEDVTSAKHQQNTSTFWLKFKPRQNFQDSVWSNQYNH